MKKVITISREFGSGGREFGIKLAERLGLPFYDKEIISEAAKNSGLSESFVASIEESVPKLFSATLYSYYQLPMSDQIFIAQSEVIKLLAKRGPCIIVGRCADAVLTDSINIFVHADIEHRIRRKLELDIGVPEDKMEKHILSVDRKRKKYHSYYSHRDWGVAKDYHIALDTGLVGIDGCLDAATAYLKYVD